MNPEKDAYGQIIKDIYTGENPNAGEIIERDDGYIDSSGTAEYLFSAFEEWGDDIKQAIDHAEGRVLDIGCGAGRHSLYLQNQGHTVIGLDQSPLAVEVAQERGLQRTVVGDISSIKDCVDEPVDTVLLLGNNFGLLGLNPVERLHKLDEITTDEGKIITQVRDYSKTDNLAHKSYHQFNRSRNRRPGCVRIRIRYKHFTTDWINYLYVDYNEFQDILSQTPWTETQKYVTEKGFTSILE